MRIPRVQLRTLRARAAERIGGTFLLPRGLPVLLGLALVVCSCRRGPEVPSYPITPKLDHYFPVVYHDGPLQLDLAWELDPSCPPLRDYRVFVHFIDTKAKQVRYYYDHDPPLPTSGWQAGTTVKYELLTFLEGVSYDGPLEIQIGLYDRHQIRTRPQLRGQARGKHQDAYAVGRVEFRPPNQRYLPLYKAGWFELETAAVLGEWRWTSKRAVASFKAPASAATLYLKLSFPVQEVGGSQTLTVSRGEQILGRLERRDPSLFIAKIEVPSDPAIPVESWFDLNLEANPGFQPSLQGPNADTRELGVKVHHLFLRPSSEDAAS